MVQNGDFWRYLETISLNASVLCLQLLIASTGKMASRRNGLALLRSIKNSFLKIWRSINQLACKEISFSCGGIQKTSYNNFTITRKEGVPQLQKINQKILITFEIPHALPK